MAKPVTFYFLPLSFYSQKGRFFLEEKEVPYKEHFIYLHFSETHQPWYMKINPEGKVPILQHGDDYIPDSQKIGEYVDKNFDGPKLISDESWPKRFCELSRELVIDVMSYGVILHSDLARDSELPKIFIWIAKNATYVDFKEKYNKLAEQNPELREAYLNKIDELSKRQENIKTKAVVEDTINKTRNVVDMAEKKLVQNAEDGRADDWLCGQQFTSADIELAILLRRLKFLGLAYTTFQDGNHSQLENYYRRLLKRKSFQKVCMYPPSYLVIRYAVKFLMIGAKKVMGYAVLGAAIGGIGYLIYTFINK